MWQVAVLDRATLALDTLVERYTRLQLRERLWTPDTWNLDVPPLAEGAGALRRGALVTVTGTGAALLVETVERDTYGEVHVEGICVGGRFAKRICLPPADGVSVYDEQTGAAETRMRHYVDTHAITAPEDARRSIPNLALEPTDQGRGATATTAARYDQLDQLLAEIGKPAGIGWRIRLESGVLRFEVVAGADRSAGDNPVVLDVALDSADVQRMRASDADRLTWVYGGGPGEGLDRWMVADGTTDAGFDRLEGFLDGRSKGPDALADAVKAHLAEHEAQPTVEVDLPDQGPYRYPDDIGLGDLVLVRNTSWDVSLAQRVVEVARTLSGEQTLSTQISVGEPWPQIDDRLEDHPAGSLRN